MVFKFLQVGEISSIKNSVGFVPLGMEDVLFSDGHNCMGINSTATSFCLVQEH